MGKQGRPRPINRHAAPKAAGCWGPAALRTCPFASLLRQVRARLRPGGYCRRSGNGGPQTCLHAACSVAQVGGPARPIFISSSSRPSRGAMPRGADDRKLPQERPHQAGSRGGGEIKAGHLVTIETRRAPGGRRPAQCPCFPFGAKGASTCQGIRQWLLF